MKHWNITLKAENEKEALKLINLLQKTFEIGCKLDEPVHHISASGENYELICGEVKQSKK